MANNLYLNRVIIWKPKLYDKFAVRESAAGRLYYENGIAKKTKDKTYRYAKNYEIGDGDLKTKYCLMFLTPSSDAAAAEKFLDETSKKLDLAQVQHAVMVATDASFEYTDIMYEEKQ